MGVDRPVQGTGRLESLPHAAQYMGRMEQKKRSHVKCRRLFAPLYSGDQTGPPDFAEGVLYRY